MHLRCSLTRVVSHNTILRAVRSGFKDLFSVAGFSEQYGTVFAVPGVGEKGYIDVRVEVTSPGGHSSVPPPHTVSFFQIKFLSQNRFRLFTHNHMQSIGILSSLLVAFEAHPYPTTIVRQTPVYESMQCFAAHGSDMPDKLRKAIVKSVKSDKAMKKLEHLVDKMLAQRSLVGTTQAIDLIQGGVKTNALPESAWAVVNHRIATQR